MTQADIGLIGLAVMGENLVMNIESHGFRVAVYNRTTSKVDAFCEGRAAGKNIVGCHSLPELVGALARPRKIMMMVKAGAPVDDLISQLIPLLEPGDILIDGGNSHFADTARRQAEVEAHGLLYVGCGVSGGEEGALTGPALMPGGSAAAWPAIQPIFQSICAHTEAGESCCAWIGPGGAGHFVKMVHNGIEYGDMQLICEAYQLMKDSCGLTNDELARTFASWQEGELDSYLIEITAAVLRHKEPDGTSTVDHILDTAGQKGTGKWAAIEALDEAVPLTLICEAVFARCLSAAKEERVHAAQRFVRPTVAAPGDVAVFCEQVRQATYAAKIISYAQGFALMRAASQKFDWNLNYGEIALTWRDGCIIRSVFLDNIKAAFDAAPDLENLILDDFFAGKLESHAAGWRASVAAAVAAGIPVPAMSAALAYFDGATTENLPANLLQAQRDYFGAHTYERRDAPRGEFFHTNWTGHGGTTSASTYTA